MWLLAQSELSCAAESTAKESSKFVKSLRTACYRQKWHITLVSGSKSWQCFATKKNHEIYREKISGRPSICAVWKNMGTDGPGGGGGALYIVGTWQTSQSFCLPNLCFYFIYLVNVTCGTYLPSPLQQWILLHSVRLCTPIFIHKEELIIQM